MCEDDIMTLENEILTLKMKNQESVDASTPKVNDFLDIADAANTEGLEDGEYLSNVLAPLLTPAIEAGELTAFEAEMPSLTLGADCDQKAAEDFATEADALAA